MAFCERKVIFTVFLCPVRWSKVWQAWKGGLYRCKLAAPSVWLPFSTRCRPKESETHQRGNAHSEKWNAGETHKKERKRERERERDRADRRGQ
ncbi:hypothetical protein EYF80_045128 [Liparis tanakae]|uniref:Uncharacterized protein n=1 Tax=Liparis tanakae TaxID=230148 RepID=A0A4Z2FWC8_9TELE|nr:hypothetical protein EYF80_045128 [Liparis tanakae]